MSKINYNYKYHLDNIAKYIDLNPESIIDIKYGRTGDSMTNRTLSKRKRGKKIKKKKKVFFNQVSIKIMIDEKKDRPVNIKLFSNGSRKINPADKAYCWQTTSICSL